MASIRLHTANAVLRNLRRVNTNYNVRLTLRREKHLISGNLIHLTKRTSPSLISMPSSNPFQITYRLEHGTVIASEKIVSSTAATAETPKSTAAEGVSDVKIVGSDSLDVISKSFDESKLPEIPETPGVSTFIEEPALSSLGIGGWSPPGIIQQILEFFHVTFDMPWWACIVSLTVIVRVLLFPLTVKSKRATVHFQNNMPMLRKLESEMSAARKSGNYFEAARTSQEFLKFTQQQAVSPFEMMLTMLVQAPVFISVFLALRNMAALPNFTSFQTGGLFWFPDLSIPDQFYLLPLLTSVTIGATLKYSTALPSMRSVPHIPTKSVTDILVYGAPVIVFLFTMKFPAAVLCYWTVTNFFVLGQTYLLSLTPVKKYFRIPEEIPPPPVMHDPHTKKLGIVEGFKQSYENMKITREIQERELVNAMKFEEIGTKPAKRTFKFDPTKIPKTVQAKEK